MPFNIHLTVNSLTANNTRLQPGVEVKQLNGFQLLYHHISCYANPTDFISAKIESTCKFALLYPDINKS